MTWTALALRFSNLPVGEPAREAIAWACFLGFAAAFLLYPRRRRTLGVLAATFAAVAVWFWLIPPSHERDWTTDVAVLPSATIDGGGVTVHNVRNFDYRTSEDYTVRYEDRTYDLGELETIDYIISDWGLGHVAHAMFSFGFGDGDYLTVSAETRREKNEPQTGLRGLFKQYELIIILGDERDLIRLRSHFRGEDVYLYPLRADRDEVRRIFLELLGRVNRIREWPEFYHTLWANCTTLLVPSPESLNRPRRLDHRILLNGRSAEMLHENGRIDTELSYEQARRRHHLDPEVRDAADFSRRVRAAAG